MCGSPRERVKSMKYLNKKSTFSKCAPNVRHSVDTLERAQKTLYPRGVGFCALRVGGFSFGMGGVKHG